LHPGFEIFGFIDKDINKAQKACNTWGGQYSSNIVCDSIMKYVDVVVIATPDNAHYELLKQLVNYPLKLVICEKPLTTDLNEAREIVGLYKSRNIPLMVDNTRNYIPCLRALTEEHGKANFGYCLFNRGWLHSAIHAIGFFNMLGLDNYKIKEVDQEDGRKWILVSCFEDGFIWSEERITDNMPVPKYYDQHMQYVADNAFKFLEGEQFILYDATKALKDIEKCFLLMKNMV